VQDVPVPLRAPPVQSRSVTLPPPPPRGDGTKAEVLLVDDEAEERSALARIFGRGGWSVREASTAEEALAWLLSVGAHTAPAIVLCDLDVPGMGGRGMYDHLKRERPEFLGRLIFSVDDSVDASDIDFLAAARCQSVRKPFAVGDIGRAVDEVLGPAGG
jgi:CheY-like chemotaxis protein